MKPTIGIIGMGKVGTTLARLWDRAGYSIVAVYNRTTAKTEALTQHIPAAIVTQSPEQVVEIAQITFLTVADDAIATVTEQLVGMNWRGKAVVHTSGAASLDKLQALAEVDAMIGGLHPVFPFAEVETALTHLPGATFALESSHATLQHWLLELVESIKGQPMLIPPGQKALYHAALAIASNYTVTLYAIAESLLLSLGADRAAADNALDVLVTATVNNIREQGIPQALTGPLSRADIGTIKAHLAAIHDETLSRVYRDLARLSYPMLQQRGVDITGIEDALRENDETSNDS